jgi:asparagine synthase (glutamine-hydrolysing)
MSGFAGVVRLDGGAIDELLMRRMAAALAFRGPDRTAIRIADGAGLAYTQLVTTDEGTRERQPLTLDGTTWIVGDARLDARRDLIARLPDADPAVLLAAPDIELVLRAYHARGARAVEWLQGDFAFAVWDSHHHRVFAARDQMGVRPLYYACLGSTIVFSNTLDCVRLHPGVPTRLNDQAIADFLLFDLNQDPDTTVFAGIHRLAPAHTLSATREGVATTRYWELPIDEPQFFRKVEDYTEAFQSLLQASIDDRLRTRSVGVFMSGGLDSTSLTAMTARRMRQRGGGGAIKALTWAEDGHDGGRERHYAAVAARYIGISHDVHAVGADSIDWRWERESRRESEPNSCAWRTAAADAYHRRIASSLRVVFHGEGPDNALQYEWQPYLRYLIGTRRASRIGRDALHYLITQQRFPSWNRLVSADGVAHRTSEALSRSFPTWLHADFDRRLRLRDRWHEVLTPPPPAHPVRPESYASLLSPLWPKLFEWYEPERTRVPLQVRHPFVDLRLLRFMLAVPPVPWCRGKSLLRRAMRGELPRAVLERRKESLPPRQLRETERRLASAPFKPVPSLAPYVDVHRLPDPRRAAPHDVEALLRVRSLNRWLHAEEEHNVEYRESAAIRA